MDDIREQMDLANEISDAISQPVNFGAEFDEDELNEELELLEQQELDEMLLEKGSKADISEAPAVPKSEMPGTFFISLKSSYCKSTQSCQRETHEIR